MADGPRSRLREALAEALTGKAIGRRSKNDWTPTFVTQPWDAEYLADAVVAVLPEHRDDVRALDVEQGDAPDRWSILQDDLAALRAENERLREALRKVEYLGSQAQSNAAVHMGMIARAALSERPSKAQRHQEHYRTCDCLGDSAECCDPSCCAAKTSTDLGGDSASEGGDGA